MLFSINTKEIYELNCRSLNKFKPTF